VGLLPNLREEPKTSNGSIFSQGRVQGGEMIEKELTKILNAHKKWVQGEGGGRANLREANLGEADLWGANLGGADFTNTILPPPTLLLLCNWGRVSDELTTELMRYDATNHPHPHKFQEWADGGGCPYNRGFPRVAHFQECRECWKSGKAKSARELVLMLFKERDIKYNLNL